MKYAGKGNSEKILVSAASALMEWDKNTVTLDDCIETIRRTEPDVARSAASILFEYFRHKSFLDDLVMGAVSRGSIKPELKAVVLCALTQALFQTAIAGESAVNVAVEHIKHSKHRSAAGFLNAVLRSALRTSGKGPFEPSFPSFLRQRWQNAFGTDAEGAIQACFRNPPLTFRLRSGELPDELSDCMEIPLEFDTGFRFFSSSSPEKVLESAAFQDGRIYIQDPATALSVSLCRGRIHGRVLDACAAPGGKTVMLYDARDGEAEITASDQSSTRMIPMRENFERLHLEKIRILEMNALTPVEEPASFDLVFLDAPCSNTGVSRRRPDALWRFHEKRLNEVVLLQRKILDSTASLVKSGGCLLYSTCSVEPDEDLLQTESFLKRHPEFELRKKSLLLPSAEHDGAFAALLEKNDK